MKPVPALTVPAPTVRAVVHPRISWPAVVVVTLPEVMALAPVPGAVWLLEVAWSRGAGCGDTGVFGALKGGIGDRAGERDGDGVGTLVVLG